MAINIQSVLKVILPTRTDPKGVSQTSTFRPSATNQILTMPAYQEHLSDISTTRLSQSSQVLLKSLFVHDPDVSAAVAAFLTVANTKPSFIVKDVDGQIDRAGQQALNLILTALTTRFDYSKGFQLRPSLESICDNMRYMVLLRGGVAAELVLNKLKIPESIRQVDLATLRWTEPVVNSYIPKQIVPGSGTEVILDIPTFFVSFFRRDPTTIYTNSPFVSAINTIAARAEVINDLYRIMKFTGYPRIEITVMEEILKKQAPANIQADAEQLDSWVSTQLQAISSTVSTMRADQAFVHTDSVEAKIMNEKNPSAGLNIDGIISALNAQNQAGLRSMSTILGRGESGVNTASVEARIFAMNAGEINGPVGDIWSQILTMAIRISGFETSYVECSFAPAEMRSELELEPQLIMKATRLKADLSLGIISDDEYHLEMYGRIRPDTAPELSGTGFDTSGPAANTDNVSPNGDPLGRSLTPPGSKSAKPVTKKKVKSKPLT